MNTNRPDANDAGLALGVTGEDINERAQVEYNSVYTSTPKRKMGYIKNVEPGRVTFIEDSGRILVLDHGKVRMKAPPDEDPDDHPTKKIGESPGVTVYPEYEVTLSGHTNVRVAAEDAEAARQKAMDDADFGDLRNATDANAAERVE